jgi:anti-sigma factor RsiW
MHEQDSEMNHAAAWELLPWYVNDTLDQDERRAVHTHLQQCAECRHEEASCREMAAAVRSGHAAPSPHPAQLARLLERLDDPRPESPLRAILAAPRGVRVALAAQAAALVTLLAIVFWPATPAPYRTLESPAASAVAAGGQQVRLVFAAEATESEIRHLLLEVGAEITGGPSPLGAYTVTLPAAGPASEPLPVVLAHLRGHPRVRFAEPVAGGGAG